MNATNPAVLIIDDEPDFAEDLAAILTPDFEVRHVRYGEEGIREIAVNPPHAVILDLIFEGKEDGISILTSIKQTDPDLPVIMVTQHHSAETEAKAVDRGALYYIRKSAGRNEIVAKLKSCFKIVGRTRSLRKELRSERGAFLFLSPAMREIERKVRKVASVPNMTVLITGESGTGKSLLAKEIHHLSSGTSGPFVDVNSATITGDTAKAELFGYQKGIFTGADRDRKGLFESACGGTLFIDEIGDLHTDSQALLLKAIDEKKIRPVGSYEQIPVDLRIVAATNRDLGEMVGRGMFRNDLYQRLLVISLHLPPLRRHPDCIPDLAGHFLSQIAEDMRIENVVISREGMAHLQGYSWARGNARELRNTIMRALVYRGDSLVLGPEAFDLPTDDPPAGFHYETEKTRVLQAFERSFYERAFARVGGDLRRARPVDIKRVADLTGVVPETVRRFLRKHGPGGE